MTRALLVLVPAAAGLVLASLPIPLVLVLAIMYAGAQVRLAILCAGAQIRPLSPSPPTGRAVTCHDPYRPADANERVPRCAGRSAGPPRCASRATTETRPIQRSEQTAERRLRAADRILQGIRIVVRTTHAEP